MCECINVENGREMNLQIYNIIDSYFKENNLDLEDLTLKQHIDNIITIIFKSIENVDNYYDEVENKNNLPLIVRKIFYVEYKKYIEPYLNNINNQIKNLDAIPLINQREEGWYAFRNELISASSIHSVLNYSTPNSLLLEKIGVSMPFIQNEPIIHGIIFEIVSQCLYESRNDIKIKEYGCIPHSTYSFIGASPDGVVNYINENEEYDIYRLALSGRLLEIKNPSSRNITNTIKPSYYSQIITQQEVCKLPICDFLETKFNKYNNIDEFFNCCIDFNYFETVDNNYIPFCNLSSNYQEKGILLKFRKDKSYTSDLYPLDIPYEREKIEEWIDIKVKEYKDNGFDFEQTIYWELSEYSVQTVKFNKTKWDTLYIKSKELWDDVLEYRKLSDSEVLEKIKKYDLELIDKDLKEEKPETTKYKVRNIRKKKENKIITIKANEYNF